MSPADALANAGAFTVQLAAVVAAARLLEAVLPVDRPRARLVYWQAVLLLVLALPFVQPWRVLPYAPPPSPPSPAAPPALVDHVGDNAPHEPAAMSLPAIVFVLLAAGSTAAAVRLAIAAGALRRARRRSRWLPTDAAAAGIELRISRDVTSPVTFGLRRPVILLPETFEHLGEAERRSVLCHETVHVERYDWLAQTFEELLRVPLWFHPAFHWLLGRLRLAREQSVDAEVVRRLGARTAYLEALVALATSGRASRLVPAATFFTRSHLAERVDLLLKEEPMSRVRVLLSLASSAAAVALCAAGVMTMAPFHVSAETVVLPAPLEAATRAEDEMQALVRLRRELEARVARLPATERDIQRDLGASGRADVERAARAREEVLRAAEHLREARRLVARASEEAARDAVLKAKLRILELHAIDVKLQALEQEYHARRAASETTPGAAAPDGEKKAD